MAGSRPQDHAEGGAIAGREGDVGDPERHRAITPADKVCAERQARAEGRHEDQRPWLHAAPRQGLGVGDGHGGRAHVAAALHGERR